MPEEKAKIFLADERGMNQLDWFRSYTTFNFGNYHNKHKKSFGELYVLNDDTLAAAKSLWMTVEEPADVLLLPIVGAVKFKADHISSEIIEPGQTLLYSANKNSTIAFTNPYENDLVNFLQIWFRREKEIDNNSAEVFSFNINGFKNSLIELLDDHSNFKIGKYKGREEGVYKITESNGLFVFIIEGAFEVQGRLLHQRDGLALWNISEVGFEALSNDAILLFLEIKKPGQ